MPSSHRFFIVVLLTVPLGLGLGCGDATTEPPAPPESRPEASTPSSAFELPSPDLSAMDEQVARQLSDARRTVVEAQTAGALDAEGLGRLADLYHAYELLDAAETVYAESERLDPEAYRWPYARGLVAQRQGRFEVARDAYFRAYQRLPGQEASPEGIAAAWRLGRVLRETRDLEQAERFLKDAARSPSCPAALFELGQVALAADRPADAEVFFKQTLSRQDDAAQVFFPLGQALRMQGKNTEAKTYLDLAAGREVSVGGRAFCADPVDSALGQLSTGTAAWITRGQHARFAGDLPGAITAFRQAVASDPEDAVAHQALAKGLAESGDWQAAEAHFRKAAELSPESPFLANDLTTALLRLGRLEEAREQSEDILRKHPDFVPALLSASRVDKAEGRFETALGFLNRAAELRDETCGLVLESADLNARLGRFGEAAEALERCAKLETLATERRIHAAMALGRLGFPARALEPLSLIIRTEENPKVKAQALLGLGGLVLQSGDRSGAVEILQDALDLDPDLKPARLALQRLQAEQND